MSFEIYYTSAPEGLKRGTSGFSTVNATDGIPKALWDRLESLSAYRHHFSAGTTAGAPAAGGGSGENPVSYAHWLLTVSGATHHVLSRICDAGLDHTQRTNAFAHHLVLDSTEMPPGGPLWLLENPGIMATRWNNQVGNLPRRSDLPRTTDSNSNEPAICHAWAAATGDAGWGGYLADVVAKTPNKPVCILFNPGQEVMPLLAETIALLPPAARWNVTFNTYFTGMPTSATCAWRCCLAHTPAAQIGLRYAANGIVIDLTDRSKFAKGPPVTAGSKYVEIARNGPPPPPPPPPPTPVKPTLENDAATAGQPSAVGGSSSGRDSRNEGRSRSASDSGLPSNGRNSIGHGNSGFNRSPGVPFPTDDSDEPILLPDDDNLDSDPLYSVSPTSRKTPKASPVSSASRQTARVGRLSKSVDEEWAQRHKVKTSETAAPDRRRKQVVLMFVGAIAALGLGMALVWTANNRAAPPLEAFPSTPAPAPTPRLTPAPTVAPEEPVQPEPVATVTPTPNPVSPLPQPVVTHPPVRIVPNPPKPVYPSTILLTSLQRPSSNSVVDFSQTFAIPSGVINPSALISSIVLRFPGDTDGTPQNRYPYSEGVSGTFLSSPSSTSPNATLSWRGSGSLGDDELATFRFDKEHSQLTLSWKSAALVREPAIVRLAYWILTGSQIELRAFAGAKSTGQTFAFPPLRMNFELTGSTGADLTWPSDPPAEAVLVTADMPAVAKMISTHGAEALRPLPTGWKSSWYTDWQDKDVALRTPEKASQVVKFEKQTQTAAVSSWFSLKSTPGLKHIDSSFDKRLAEQKASLQQYKDELKGLGDQLQHVKDVNYGTIPEDDNTKSIRKHQADDQELIAAYEQAIQAYEKFGDVDVAVVLPNGLRLATLQFHQTPSKQ